MLQNGERREREMSIVAQFFMIMGGVLTGYVGIGLAAAIGNLVGGGIFRFQFDEFIFFWSYQKVQNWYFQQYQYCLY